jgi:serine/threonine protein kinase
LTMEIAFGAAAGVVVLGIVLVGVKRWRRRRRIEYWRGVIESGTPYRVDMCLGLGREGIVYRVRSREQGDGPWALKVMDSRDRRDAAEQLELLKSLEAARDAAGLEGWASLPRVHEAALLRAGGHEVPYEVMELVEGETLREAAESGTLREWTLDERLSALDDLLLGLEALSGQRMNFIHIDADNVMATPDRRLKLIDLSGFRTRGLTPRRRRRIFRRLARTILVLLDDHRVSLLRGDGRAGAAELFELLSLYEGLPKGTRPPQEVELFSIESLRAKIAACLPRG